MPSRSVGLSPDPPLHPEELDDGTLTEIGAGGIVAEPGYGLPARVTSACLLLLPALLAAAQPVSATELRSGTRVGDRVEWSWTEPLAPGQAVELQLVRADVRVEPSASGRLEVHAAAEGDPSHAEAVVLRTEAVEGGIRIVDQFPVRSPRLASGECLPPAGDRGDFWTYRMRLRLTLRVPSGTTVTGAIMSGAVDDAR